MALFTKPDDTDWRALFLEERAKVDRLTQQIVRLKKQGFAPAPEPRPKPEPDADGQPVVPVPSEMRSALPRVAAQIKLLNPDVTDEDARLEAARVVAQFAG